jgi:hypothetical protein
MRCRLIVLIAGLSSCSGRGPEEPSGSVPGSGGAMTSGVIGETDCSDLPRQQVLSCEIPTRCCAVATDDNYCADDCSGASLIMECDGSEDCGGGLCCWDGQDAGAHSICVAGNECQRGSRLCRTSSECSSDAPCCGWQEVNGVIMSGCISPGILACR